MQLSISLCHRFSQKGAGVITVVLRGDAHSPRLVLDLHEPGQVPLAHVPHREDMRVLQPRHALHHDQAMRTGQDTIRGMHSLLWHVLTTYRPLVGDEFTWPQHHIALPPAPASPLFV